MFVDMFMGTLVDATTTRALATVVVVAFRSCCIIVFFFFFFIEEEEEKNEEEEEEVEEEEAEEAETTLLCTMGRIENTGRFEWAPVLAFVLMPTRPTFFLCNLDLCTWLAKASS